MGKISKVKVRVWNSIVVRLGLFFIGLIVFALFVSGFLIYNKSSLVITEYSKERIQYTSNLAGQQFYALLDEVSNDIAVMTNNPLVKAFIGASDFEARQNLEALISATLRYKPSYFQVRLLNIKENGKEVLRFDKKNGEIIKTPEDSLQFKGSRSYYLEALTQEPDSYYFSPINLNEEYGRVSDPHIPTLRAASVIYDDDRIPQAMLVINVDLRDFYQNLFQIMETDVRLDMVDANNQYLFSIDTSKCFGEQLQTGESFRKDFGQSIEEVHQEANGFDFIQNNEGISYLYHKKEMPYSQNQKSVYLISSMKRSQLLQSAIQVRNNSFQTILIVCLVVLFLALLVIRFFSNQIKLITLAIGDYSEDANESQSLIIPENRRDEIGVLARTFLKMKARIDQQMTELKASLKKEQKATKERDEFLQNMSHELRTPLNGILGLTQLLIKNNPSESQKPIIDALDRSANNLAGLMYDVLDHQKLLEGKVNLKYVPCNIYELLYDIHTSHQFEAMNKGLKFELSVDNVLKKNSYQMDPLRFTQIVTNLVVNAIKYTQHGTVQVKVKVIENTQLEVCVVDTGVGILPENLKKIKERFYRENEDLTGRYGSYGLGLSIVRQLVSLFGAEMNVDSTKEKGSSFSVRFSLVSSDTQQQTKLKSYQELHLPVLNGTYTILHIEDDHSTVQFVQNCLMSESLTYHSERNWQGATQFLESNHTDLIISDLMLDNHRIDEELKTRIIQNELLPVLIISALEKEIMSELSPMNMQKPIHIDEFIRRVYAILGASEYDYPQLQTAYAQYDNNSEKILNFLNLLIDEFEGYVMRIHAVYHSKDSKEWEAIRHKIITHIRSLDLKKLQTLLPEKVENLEEKRVKEINNELLYCLCCFHSEKYSIE